MDSFNDEVRGPTRADQRPSMLRTCACCVSRVCVVALVSHGGEQRLVA